MVRSLAETSSEPFRQPSTILPPTQSESKIPSRWRTNVIRISLPRVMLLIPQNSRWPTKPGYTVQSSPRISSVSLRMRRLEMSTNQWRAVKWWYYRWEKLAVSLICRFLEVFPHVLAIADSRLHTRKLGHKNSQGKDPVALQRSCACWILVSGSLVPLLGGLFAKDNIQ